MTFISVRVHVRVRRQRFPVLFSCVRLRAVFVLRFEYRLSQPAFVLPCLSLLLRATNSKTEFGPVCGTGGPFLLSALIMLMP